jgi:hypothetical protein
MYRSVGDREGRGVRRSLRALARGLAVGLLGFGLAACGGGGGGGGDDNNPPPATGSLSVTVSDTFGVRVSGATVRATVGTSTRTGTTDAQGVALVTNVVAGAASVEVSRSTFLTRTVPATVTANQTTNLSVTLDRSTSAAGGSLTSRGAFVPTPANNGQTLTFEVELVIVNSDSQPIQTLTAADFSLLACTPNVTNAPLIDCVRGAAADYDKAYAPVPATGDPASSTLVAGGAAQAYAAALMLDQSRSINGSDPTGARLFSAKAFLEGLGGGDRVLLSAFANDSTTTALIPDTPLTVYGPFRDSGTVTAAPSYFTTLDSLADLVGGGTPLYESLDLLRERVVTDATLPAGIAKAVVIFTDGDDTDCGGANTCRTIRNASVAAANADNLRVFTIGLSNGVNFEALGDLANRTGGAFLFAESAEQLIPLYGSVGRLLSLSLPTYRLRFTFQATEANVFVSGNALLGRVEVTVGAETFPVPFIVGIP